LIPPDGGFRILNPERDTRFVGIAQNEQMLALVTGSVQAAMLTPPFDSMIGLRCSSYQILGHPHRPTRIILPA